MIISAAVEAACEFSLASAESLSRIWGRNSFCVRFGWVFHAETPRAESANSSACTGFTDPPGGMNKQLLMGECRAAMTHVLGKADKLVDRSFLPRWKVHTQFEPQTLEPFSPSAGS